MNDSPHPSLKALSGFGIEQLPQIAYGRGSYLYDAAGKRYLDGSGGPAVYSVGHAHPQINEAIRRQMDRVAHGYRYSFTSEASDALDEIVKRRTDGGFGKIIFVSSGSEAVESCLKIALQYWAAVGKIRKRRFISRRRSWHGNTLGVLSVADFKARRDAF